MMAQNLNSFNQNPLSDDGPHASSNVLLQIDSYAAVITLDPNMEACLQELKLSSMNASLCFLVLFLPSLYFLYYPSKSAVFFRFGLDGDTSYAT